MGVVPRLSVPALVRDAVQLVVPGVSVPGVMGNLVHGHALRNVAVLAHDELCRNEVPVTNPVAHDALGLAVALRVVQHDVVLVFDALGPVRQLVVKVACHVKACEKLIGRRTGWRGRVDSLRLVLLGFRTCGCRLHRLRARLPFCCQRRDHAANPGEGGTADDSDGSPARYGLRSLVGAGHGESLQVARAQALLHALNRLGV